MNSEEVEEKLGKKNSGSLFKWQVVEIPQSRKRGISTHQWHRQHPTILENGTFHSSAVLTTTLIRILVITLEWKDRWTELNK